MLLSFDASQVRKICRDCKKVLDYLAISEVIETMEDLVQFVKDLSPCLSKVVLSTSISSQISNYLRVGEPRRGGAAAGPAEPADPGAAGRPP